MRAWWMMLAVAFFLSACQQPGPTSQTRPATSSSSRDSGESYFEPEVNEVMSEIGDKLADGCFNQAQNREKLEDCIRDKFAVAFDDSGMGRNNCDFHTALADYLSCVAIGNTLLELRHRLSDDSPVPAGFWSGDTAMSDAVFNTVILRGVDACGKTSATQKITDCIEKWFEERLALPKAMTDRCASAPEDERVRCLAEAYMLRFLQDRTSKLGATSI